MMRTKVFLQLFLIGATLSVSVAELLSSGPHEAESLNVTYIQMKNSESCPYTLIISTSCFSPEHTGDQISISFGDAHGNQIYAPRLDSPTTKAFERCATDTFQINGHCAHEICYVYLYRSGQDGWRPQSVQIFALNSTAVTYEFDVSIPSDTWYGFNNCTAPPLPPPSSSPQLHGGKWFLCAALGLVFSYFWM